jgi:hypothetical protein
MEPEMDVVSAVHQYAKDLRAGYRCEPTTWVLNPHEYDAVAAAVACGAASEDVRQFFTSCIRAESVG